jgi:predicted ATPase/class 3 adenylate cyclase
MIRNVKLDRELPSGIVTFVFSDIEGSTKLMKRLGPRYMDVLERHRELLRTAWSAHGGAEVATEGDGCFVAFANATDAIRACAEGQRLLQAEAWPEDGVVRVRMGAHSGLAAPHHGDYVALAASQAARVTNAAHGGQVLVSEETAERCASVPGIGFVTAGRFRLRDFDEPVCLQQLTASGLEQKFPAVRALPAEGHNVVRPANTFVGRDHEASHVASLLRPGRLVTIVGPGGVGKTRLALELGVRVAEAWSDGVWVVDLSNVEDPELVGDAIGAAVGGPTRGVEGWDEIIEVLRSQNALIVLDNTEVHVEQCARLALELLKSCKQLGILTTGREPLRVAGELIVPLAPLPVPGAVSDRDEAERSAAVRLFLDRARAARPGFAFGAEAVAPIVGICRRLEGLPLAIEIAANRTSVLQPAEILAGLDDMHRLLRSRDRSLPERQRSMEALLDWSYRLLGADEKAALRRLSLFGSGFSVEAATAAVADGLLAAVDVPELIWSLVDRSLISADLTANATRYRFLETVRQYGRRLLDGAHETEPAARRLSAWYLEALGPWRAADRAWIGDVQLELDNLRAIIPLVAPFDSEAAQQLACLVGRYLDAIQAYRLGIDELQRFAAELRAETPGRVALLTTLAHLRLRIGDVDAARVALGEANNVNERTGSPSWDDAGLARTAGEVAMRTGELASAASIAEAALGQGLSPRARARMWNLLGLARSAAGDLRGALAAFEEEREEHSRAGHEAFLAGAEGNLAEIALRLGDTATAARHQHACLELALALGQPVMVAYSLIVAARLAAAGEDWWTSARLGAKANDILKEIGQRLYDDDLQASERLRAAAQEHLGAKDYAEAAGSGLSLDAPGAALLADQVLSIARTTALSGQPR